MWRRMQRSRRRLSGEEIDDAMQIDEYLKLIFRSSCKSVKCEPPCTTSHQASPKIIMRLLPRVCQHSPMVGGRISKESHSLPCDANHQQ